MLSSMGHRIRAVVAYAMVAALLAGGMAAPSSVVAQSQSIQSQLTGVNITYGPPYVIQDDATYADDVMETIMFVGSADILAMGFMSPLIDLNGARDVMLEALFGELGTTATMDRGNYTGVSYSLDMLNFDGQEMGVFSLFMNQRSHGFAEFYIFIAPPSLFTATMQTAQNTFAIDGSPLMDGVDATVMGNMVTANVGITGGTAVTDVTEVTEQADSPDTSTTETTTTETVASGDGVTYLNTLIDHRVEYMASFIRFASSLGVFSDQASTDQQKQDAIQAISDEALYWSGFSERAASVSAPAGFEDVHEVYLTWSADITTLGELWIGFLRQQGPTTEQFFAQLDVVKATDIEFMNILDAASERVDSTGTETTGTDTASTSTDSTGTESTSTDTGSSRTSRTTRASSTEEAGDTGAQNTSSRTSRTTSNTGDSTGGNSSETKGSRRVSSGSADNEWHMEVHDLTITWTDDFGLSDTAEVPQSSDAEKGEDKISLQYESSAGPVRFTITVLNNNTLDSRSLITGLTADDAGLKDLFGEDAVVIDSEVTTDASAMLVQTADVQGEYFVYVQMTCVTADCSSIAMFLMLGEGSEMVEGLTATENGVAIDGISLTNVIPVTDIDEAIGGR